MTLSTNSCQEARHLIAVKQRLRCGERVNGAAWPVVPQAVQAATRRPPQLVEAELDRLQRNLAKVLIRCLLNKEQCLLRRSFACAATSVLASRLPSIEKNMQAKTVGSSHVCTGEGKGARGVGTRPSCTATLPSVSDLHVLTTCVQSLLHR